MLEKIQHIMKETSEQIHPADEELGLFDSNVRPTPTLSHRRSGSETVQPTHRDPSHRRQNTCPVIFHIELDLDTLSQQKVSQEVCATSSLNTLETEASTFSQGTLRSDSSLVENSFRSVDDLYASLSETEKSVDVDLFLHVLNDLYANDQIVSLREQFVTKTSNLRLYQEILTSTGFYIALAYTVAGLLFTIGAIDTGLSVSVVQNMFLSGSCIYASGGAFCLFQQWKAARFSWHTLKSVAVALEQYTFSKETSV